MVADAGWMLHRVMESELENIHSLKEEQKASFLLQVTELSFPRPRTGGSIIGISCLITQGEKKYCFQTVWIKFYDHQTPSDNQRSCDQEITRALQLKALMMSFQFKIICDSEVTSWNVLRRSADKS